MAMIYCPECGANISDMAVSCPRCGCPASVWTNQNPGVQQPLPQQEPPFNGIYRTNFWNGKKTPVYCPVCKSSNCEWYIESQVIPEVSKTKTRYSANLNPLHPFTLVNKKEKKKVISPERTVSNKKIMCKSCGFTFY